MFCLFLCYKYFYNITVNDIPAPNLSTNYSFNEKMQFLKRNKRDVDVLAIGSSYTLNNLYSKTITEKFHTDSYFNTGSWATNMEENFMMLKIFYNVYQPNTLIIASNYMDFNDWDKNIKYSLVENYLQSRINSSYYYHFKTFKLRYYYRNFKHAKNVRSIKDDDYLVFGKYGALNYTSKDFNIDPKRWNKGAVDTKIDTVMYSYLDSISTFCKSKNIDLLFFQSPVRFGYYSQFKEDKKLKLTSHIKKVESILERDKHQFVNANNVIWNDDLFIDATHFNVEGAKIFTEYCFNNINNSKRQ